MRDERLLDEVEKNIGRQIRMLRISEKISQKELAQKMGITYQQIQKYENGLNRISVTRLWQFCKIFEISPDYLFEGVLGKDKVSNGKNQLIPNTVATSQDVKLMLAFKKIDSTSNRALIVKLCEAMAEEV